MNRMRGLLTSLGGLGGNSTPLTVSHALVVRRDEGKDIRDIVSLSRLLSCFDWLIKTPESWYRLICRGAIVSLMISQNQCCGKVRRLKGKGPTS